MSHTPHHVAALFVHSASVYKDIAAVDAWDATRDARLWQGTCPVIAHPPCAQWSRMRGLATPDEANKSHALWALEQVRRCTGVLEHPYHSTLWSRMGIAHGNKPDQHGGWLLDAPQSWWGHRAAKPTSFYIVGHTPASIPRLPMTLMPPTRTIGGSNTSPAERSLTPPALALWLVRLATGTPATRTGNATTWTPTGWTHRCPMCGQLYTTDRIDSLTCGGRCRKRRQRTQAGRGSIPPQASRSTAEP